MPLVQCLLGVTVLLASSNAATVRRGAQLDGEACLSDHPVSFLQHGSMVKKGSAHVEHSHFRRPWWHSDREKESDFGPWWHSEDDEMAKEIEEPHTHMGSHGQHGFDVGGTKEKSISGSATAFEDTYEAGGSSNRSFSFDGFGGFGHGQQIKGFQPKGEGPFPVYVYLMGTQDQFGSSHDMEIVKHMAGKGYLAAAVQYENQDMCLEICKSAESLCTKAFLGGEQQTLLAKANKLKGALDKLCERKSADCGMGLALMGHSQGGYLAMLLTLLDSRISAIMPLGTGNPTSVTAGLREEDKNCLLDASISKYLPKSKRRYTNGEGDALSDRDTKDDNKGLEDYSGYECDPKKPPVNCIQSDGSGYYIVGESDYDQNSIFMAHDLAGHNFFGSTDPVTYNSVLLPAYKDGKAPWSMDPSLTWLAGAALNSATAFGAS